MLNADWLISGPEQESGVHREREKHKKNNQTNKHTKKRKNNNNTEALRVAAVDSLFDFSALYI